MCRCQTFPDFNTGNKKQVFKKNLDRKLKDEEDGQVKLYKKFILFIDRFLPFLQSLD